MNRKCVSILLAVATFALTMFATPAEARGWGGHGGFGHGGWGYHGGWGHGGWGGGWGHPYYGYGSGFALGAGLGFLGGSLLGGPRYYASPYAYPAPAYEPYGYPPPPVNVYSRAYPYGW